MQIVNQLQVDLMTQLETNLQSAKASTPRLEIRDQGLMVILGCEAAAHSICIQPRPWSVFYHAAYGTNGRIQNIGLGASSEYPFEFISVFQDRPQEVILEFDDDTTSIVCDAWLLNKLMDELEPLGNATAADQAALAKFIAAARELVQKGVIPT
jgi:hypothetical protein